MANSNSGPWWKSLTNSKKKSKEAPGEVQPPAPPPSEEAAPPSPDWTGAPRENLLPSLSGGVGEPPKPDKLSTDNLGNSRRNLKISRSGRFKEKRKMRATLLPEEEGVPGDPLGDNQ
ncbi:PREDICTED: proline-rich protein 15 [Elephantulus edwardii]|uniref:proline-rich protein 15 n=1 Tax=Elephantulus edwardii TaxID=28737 RepID=UPI0003F0B5FD|nr:PREDICTED: proline-rich protein 15 [Elephantulus edwardii]